METQPQARRKRVLIVDDDPGDSAALKRLVEAQGHDVDIAFDAGAAIAVGQRFHPDVIFIDIRMPVLDGYETCAKLRNEPWGKSAAIYTISGFSRLENEMRGAKAGVDGHFHKPMTPELVRHLLSQ